MHGNEASGRESCFTQARQLAFSTDPAIVDMLSKMTMLMVPSINADGRAANTRGNSTGQDLNRDHALIEQNETKGYAKMLRDYTPDVGLDNHEGDSEDLPILAARHRNVYEPLFEEGKFMVNEWMYGAAAQSGWWMGPYSTGGDSHEGILRNTASLKHAVSMLGEARAAAGATRPGRGPAATRSPNRIRKAYAHLWENWEIVRYFAARMTPIRTVNAASEAAALANVTGTTILRGAYPWPVITRGRRDRTTSRTWTRRWRRGSSRRRRAATSSPRPSTRWTAPSEADDGRHGRQRRAAPRRSTASRSSRAPGGVFVPLRQRLRGLIAPILDSQAVLPMIDDRRAPVLLPRGRAGRRQRAGDAVADARARRRRSAAFTPGVRRDYEASTSANVISTAGDATLSVADPATTNTGKLVNGTFALAQTLQAKANTGTYAPVGGSANPTSLLTYRGPVSNDSVTLGFKQTIGRNEPLRTGTYAKTLTFTLSTTNP